jgi:hypothetical protein
MVMLQGNNSIMLHLLCCGAHTTAGYCCAHWQQGAADNSKVLVYLQAAGVIHWQQWDISGSIGKRQRRDMQTAAGRILLRLLAAGSCRQQPGIAVVAGSRCYSLTTVGYFPFIWQATVLWYADSSEKDITPMAASKFYDAQATATCFCIYWQEATILWRTSLLPVMK